MENAGRKWFQGYETSYSKTWSKKEIIMFRKQQVDWWVLIIGFSDLGEISARIGDTCLVSRPE